MDIALIRSGLRAATARPIRFVIPRSRFDGNGLDACGALVGCRRERPLSRGEPRDGMAARRFSWANGKEFKSACAGTLADDGRPSAGNLGGNPSLRVAGRYRRMAASDPD